MTSRPHSELVARIREAIQHTGNITPAWTNGMAALRELEEQLELARSLDTGRLAVRVDRAEAELRSTKEQLEANQRVVDEARFYFDRLRRGEPALTIGIEQALSALNPASRLP